MEITLTYNAFEYYHRERFDEVLLGAIHIVVQLIDRGHIIIFERKLDEGKTELVARICNLNELGDFTDEMFPNWDPDILS